METIVGKKKFVLHYKCVIEYRKDTPSWGYAGIFVFYKKHDFKTHEEAEEYYRNVRNN